MIDWFPKLQFLVMAKRKPASSDAPVLNDRMRRHIGQLAVRSLAAYLEWCREHGFRVSTDKSSYDRAEELQAHLDGRAKIADQARIHHNPEKLIEKACAGEVAAKDIKRPQLHLFCRSIEQSLSDQASRTSLRKLLLAVNERADFLFDSATFEAHTVRYVDALTKLNDRRRQWLRPLDEWRSPSHNGRKQFSSLVRHLMAEYPVPEFMDQAWLRTDTPAERYRSWFCHLGAGNNIRTADTPVPLTKLMAHHFLTAPDTVSIEAALRWGQIHALGGDRTLFEAVLGSRIGTNFKDEEFWLSVIRFFVLNPLLDRRHVGPIVDYLYNQKFHVEEVYLGHGRVERRPPPQPNLTMRGRTAASMLAQVERWHVELGRGRGAEKTVFRRSPLRTLELATGRDGENVWRIRQLTTGAELLTEGRVMHHCVASYANSCASGACSIWTMELHHPDRVEKRQTIEVSRLGQIVQCRGKHNRLPTRAEFDILQEWARAAGLQISRYVQPAS